MNNWNDFVAVCGDIFVMCLCFLVLQFMPNMCLYVYIYIYLRICMRIHWRVYFLIYAMAHNIRRVHCVYFASPSSSSSSLLSYQSLAFDLSCVCCNCFRCSLYEVDTISMFTQSNLSCKNTSSHFYQISLVVCTIALLCHTAEMC